MVKKSASTSHDPCANLPPAANSSADSEMMETETEGSGEAEKPSMNVPTVQVTPDVPGEAPAHAYRGGSHDGDPTRATGGVNTEVRPEAPESPRSGHRGYIPRRSRPEPCTTSVFTHVGPLSGVQGANSAGAHSVPVEAAPG